MFKKIVGLGFSTKGKNSKDVEKYIETLIQSGASEFFTGYNPPYWYEKFGFEVSPNGRFAEHEQISDAETLKIITQEVHKYGLEIFANLNAWYYTDITFPYVERMVEEFIKIGIDGIICGNISILEYLKEINYKGKINISTIFALYNVESIKFFLENYNINKIILSREITLQEIENIVKTFPNTKFEVFGEGDFCRYNNGFCFAEHKYGTRDICTVVENELIIKKKFISEFKKIILDKSILEFDKIIFFDDKFEDIFERIGNILTKIELKIENIENLKNELFLIFKKTFDKVDLFFDGLKGINNKKNKQILIYLRGLKFILNSNFVFDENEKNKLEELKKELEKGIKTGMEYFVSKLKLIGGEPKLKALEKGISYSKGDLLNLYSYLFFSKFGNIETVKFPTRGRNYNEKLKLIEKTVNLGKVEKNILDRGISMERTHYDLTYLFKDKLWFRKFLNDNF